MYYDLGDVKFTDFFFDSVRTVSISDGATTKVVNVSDDTTQTMLRGPMGVKGQKGFKGFKGAVGDKGEEGIRGVKGEGGDRGDTGDTVTGPKGAKGDGGAKGAKGSVGDRGDTGATGSTGAKGDVGADSTLVAENFSDTSLTYPGSVISVMHGYSVAQHTVSESEYTTDHIVLEFTKRRDDSDVLLYVSYTNPGHPCAVFVSSDTLAPTLVTESLRSPLAGGTVLLQNVKTFSAHVRGRANYIAEEGPWNMQSCSITALEVSPALRRTVTETYLNNTLVKSITVDLPDDSGNTTTTTQYYSASLDSLATYDMLSYDTMLRDKSVNQLDLTVYGSPAVSTQGISFDGANDYMSGALPNPSGAWSHSVAFWIHVPSSSGAGDSGTWSHSIFFFGNASELQASNLKYKKNSDSLVWCWEFWNSQVKYTEDGSFYDTWHQFVLTYDGGSNVRKIYVDGVQREPLTYWYGGDATSASKLNLPENATLEIGRDVLDRRYFEGQLRHLQIFDRVLDEEELYLLPKLWTVYDEAEPTVIIATNADEEDEEVLNPGFPEAVGNGWTEIVSIPGGASTWFTGDGNLDGHHGGEFLFATGDFSRWLIADHFQVNGENYAGNRTITKSSDNPNSHSVYWYNRSGNPEDPLISLKGHQNDVNNNMMFVENGQSGYSGGRHSSGMYVYTRGGGLGPTIPTEIGTGWAEILSLEPGSSSWFAGNGNLDGYTGGEFLFTTGDYSRWLIADHFQVNGEYYYGNRTVTKSSDNPNPHSVYWYNRSGNPEDPLISLKGHHNDVNNNMMFVENGQSGYSGARHPSGMKVYTRGFNTYVPYSSTERVYPPESVPVATSWVVPSSETGYYTTTVEGSYMDGTYSVWASHVLEFPAYTRSPPTAFDHDESATNFLWVANNTFTNGHGFASIGISLPEGIKLSKYTLKGRGSDYNQMPKLWNMDASNDGSSWVRVDRRTDETGWTSFQNREYTVSSTVEYRMYRLYIYQNNGSEHVTLFGFKLYGYQPL